MTSSYHTATATGADITHTLASTLGQANGVVKVTQEAPTTPTAGGRHQTRLKTKYRHVAALHSKEQPSCLSHEAETVPSFLGFRNLMVLVLSEQFIKNLLEHRALLTTDSSLYEPAPCHRELQKVWRPCLIRSELSKTGPIARSRPLCHGPL